MPKTSPPKHCIHKGVGQSYVKIDGRQIFTGTLENGTITADAEREYRRILAEYLTNQDRPAKPDSITIDELILRFISQKQPPLSYTDSEHFKVIFNAVLDLYAGYKAVDIGVIEVKSVREKFIGRGWGRTYVNHQMARIRQILIWGQQEGVLPQQYNPPKIKALRKGECPGLREGVSRQTVPQDVIDKTIAELTPTFAAIVRVQLATAARPSEILKMRIEQIDRTNPELWEVRYTEHKTTDTTRDKTILLGKTAIAIVTPYIEGRESGYVFRPKVAISEHKSRRWTKARYKKKTPSRKARDKARARKKRTYNQCYDYTNYARNITRACKRAGVEHWSPYQLRHTGVTLIGLQHGIEAAQHIAGHRSITTTERYFHGQDEIARNTVLKMNAAASNATAVPATHPDILSLLTEQQKTIAVLTAALLAKGQPIPPPR